MAEQVDAGIPEHAVETQHHLQTGRDMKNRHTTVGLLVSSTAEAQVHLRLSTFILMPVWVAECPLLEEQGESSTDCIIMQHSSLCCSKSGMRMMLGNPVTQNEHSGEISDTQAERTSCSNNTRQLSPLLYLASKHPILSISIHSNPQL